MRTRYLLPLIITIILSVLLASCEGIGDGALIGYNSSGVEEKTEESAIPITLEELLEQLNSYSVTLDEDVPFANAEKKCTFSMYSFTGEEKVTLSFDGNEANDLFNMVYHSRRDIDKEIDKSNKDYIDIDSYYVTEGDTVRRGKFRVYSNDYVEVTEEGLSTRVSSSILSGYVEGMYQNLISYASSAIKPDSAIIRFVTSPLSSSISPKSNEVEIVAAEAAELYKLLMSGETESLDEGMRLSVTSGYVIVSFTAECGIAQFYVGDNNMIEQTHSFLEGNAIFYPRHLDGICEKLTSYFN